MLQKWPGHPSCPAHKAVLVVLLCLLPGLSWPLMLLLVTYAMLVARATLVVRIVLPTRAVQLASASLVSLAMLLARAVPAVHSVLCAI